MYQWSGLCIQKDIYIVDYIDIVDNIDLVDDMHVVVVILVPHHMNPHILNPSGKEQRSTVSRLGTRVPEY